jgi:S-formylglutathione hydrolase FrmB
VKLRGSDAFKEREGQQTSARFWLSVGAQETETGVSHPPTGLFQRVSQIEGVEAAARSFASRGGTVHYNRYPGGHAFPSWREELAPALRWLVGSGSYGSRHTTTPPAPAALGALPSKAT